MEPVLSLQHVSKIYQEGRHEVVAVEAASLEVYPGEVILILGPSGSGKTTLLSIMGCLLSPNRGEVRVGGRDVSGLSDGELSSLRSQYIGFVFQSFNLLDFLSVRKNVEVALNLAKIGGPTARERATRILEQVNLSHRLNFYPKRLSGGEKQRVSVARALATNPRLLLADEPTGNLDSASGRIVVELLTKLARQQGSAVVIVTHDPRIMDFADRVLYLEDGRLSEGARMPAQAVSSRAFVTQ
jgi:putative ABC transport system ATP-binding protein